MNMSAIRGAVAAATAVAAALAMPVLASPGSDRPQPCGVTYQVGPAQAANTITASFGVTCAADPQWEITSIEQRTTMRDATPNGAHTECRQRVSGTAATQNCTLATARLHSYLVTYRFIARGNYAVCLDDGTCSADTPLVHPGCIQTVAGRSAGLAGSDVVLDCTYRQVYSGGNSG